MKRSSEPNFEKEGESKRFTSSSICAQYTPLAQSQQATPPPALSPYQSFPYPGSFYRWSSQPIRFRFATNVPPPPIAPPPPQPPPPNGSPPIFDLTKPPPPMRQNYVSIRVMNSSAIRPSARGRVRMFRGPQIRQRAMSNTRNIIPNSVNQLNNTNTKLDNSDGDGVLINRKAKRKPMSARYMRTKEWERKDAEKALALEKEYNKMQRTPMLILKFPDPDLNRLIVKKFSSSIDTVHFQQPCTPRYCFVTIKEDNDIEKVRKELCEVPFGTGKIVAEQKFTANEESTPVDPEEIDPYTLYIGNLPTKVCVKTVKEHFPGAARIDIGYAQRMKYTRYAFIRYESVEESMEAYKRTYNTPIGNRSLIVRFRRSKGNIGLPGESRTPNTPKKVLERDKEENDIKETAKISKKNFDQKSTLNISGVKKGEINFGEFDDDDEEEEEEDDEEDSKENVLNEARKIRLALMKSSKNNDIENFDVKQEDNEYGNNLNKPRQNENDSSTNDVPYSLLKTRIKEEPMDDDELLACARTYNLQDDNLDDDFDDEEPEEEDDNFSETLTDPNRLTETLKLERTTAVTKTFWDNESPTVSNEADVKPNLQPTSYNGPTYGFLSNRSDYARNRTNIYGSNMIPYNIDNNKKDSKSNGKDDDEDDDIFDDLNPEDDYDDFGKT